LQCAYHGQCGGCSLHSLSYDEQLAIKTEREQARFASLYPHPLTTFTTPEKHFRARIELRVWHEEDAMDFAMQALNNPKSRVLIDQCPIALEAINTLMEPLKAHIKASPLLRKRLFAVDFLGATTGEVLISLPSSP